MADLVRAPKTLEAGEVRLIGLIEQPLAGIHVDPAASQSGRGGTLVVAHLQEPPALSRSAIRIAVATLSSTAVSETVTMNRRWMTTLGRKRSLAGLPQSQSLYYPPPTAYSLPPTSA